MEAKAIPEFNGRYSARDDGAIISHLLKGHFNEQPLLGSRRLEPYVRPDGYYSVVLTKHGTKAHSYLVHRLVALTFCGEIPRGHHVAHIDGDKTNNGAQNLKICTPKENEADKKRHGTDRRGRAPGGEANKWAKLRNESVIEIRRLGAAGIKQAELAVKFQVNQVTISSILRRKTWRDI